MRMEKKQILKDDGRYLVYYHFPDSASPDETQVFSEIESTDSSPAGGGDHRAGAAAAAEKVDV